MGTIIELLKEIPLSAVLRERLADKDAEIAICKAKVASLEAENAALKAHLQKIENGKTIHKDICPFCQQPNGQLKDIRPHKIFGDHGVKVFYYKCDGCGREYDKEQELK